MNAIVIDRALAQRVLEVVDAGLVSGLGTPEPGKMCVEAAVNYAMGAPHGDDPACVSPSLRRLKIRLNDARWSSDKARTAGLRRLAIAQLGSAGALDEKEFSRRMTVLAIQKSVPEALRAAAGIAKGSHKDQLLKMADLCERQPTEQHAKEAKTAAAADFAYAAAEAAYAAEAAAAEAAYAAAEAASDASAAAEAAYASSAYAAGAGAYAAAAAAYAAGAADAHDKSLSSFAEAVVQILIEMKAPGCEWLDLTI